MRAVGSHDPCVTCRLRRTLPSSMSMQRTIWGTCKQLGKTKYQ